MIGGRSLLFRQVRRKGIDSRNSASLMFSIPNPLRASAGVSRAVIGIVPKTLPFINKSSPLRSIAWTCINAVLSDEYKVIIA